MVLWRAYQEKRPNLASIRKWFGGGDCNLAIVTGLISGLVVVDCDTAEDAAWWQEHHSPTPLVVTTGRGGSHFYYRYPDRPIAPRTGILGRKIDIRGDGAIAIVPPSIHPETGKRYEWIPWDYYALYELPILDSTWFGSARSGFGGSIAASAKPTIRRGLAYIRHIEAVAGKGGHNQTFRAACKLRDSGLSPDEALDALRDWNETNAEPPWSDKELAHKIHDAYRGL